LESRSLVTGTEALAGLRDADRRHALPSVRTAYSVLLAGTLGFTVCFAVWTMFGVIGVPIRGRLGLNNTGGTHSHREQLSHWP
jgi:NNP family nitrate/nitrite transporter-like MFS transporter